MQDQAFTSPESAKLRERDPKLPGTHSFSTNLMNLGIRGREMTSKFNFTLDSIAWKYLICVIL